MEELPGVATRFVGAAGAGGMTVTVVVAVTLAIALVAGTSLWMKEWALEEVAPWDRLELCAVEELPGVAARFVGAAGAGAVTVTVVVAVTLAIALVAVSV